MGLAYFSIFIGILGAADSSRFTKSGVGNLEKGAAQIFGTYPFAFGWFLRFCRTLFLGNHFERGILFILMG